MRALAEKLSFGLQPDECFRTAEADIGQRHRRFGDGFLKLLRRELAANARYTVRDVAVQYPDTPEVDDLAGEIRYRKKSGKSAQTLY